MTATRFSKAATIVLIAAWLAAVFFLWRTKMSYGSFVAQQAVGLLVQTATVAIVLAMIMLIARRFRRNWWLVVAPLFAAVGAVFVVVTAVLAASGAHPIRDRQVAAAARQ